MAKPASPVKVVTAFETPDGRVFSSRQEAEVHVAEQELFSVLKQFGPEPMPFDEVVKLSDQMRLSGYTLINALTKLAKLGVIDDIVIRDSRAKQTG
jgi:hypothetical protein